MEKKIPIFENLPVSELSQINDEENGNNDLHKLRSIEKEFEQTNLHTKQTPLNDDKTDNIDNTDAETKYNAENTGGTKRKTRLSSLMGEKGGGFAVDLIDMLIPTIVVLIINYFGYSLEKKDLKLNKDEKEALTPALMDVLDEINLNFDNVYVNLGIMLAIVYGTKIADKLPTIKKKEVEKLPAEKRDMSEGISAILADSENGELTPMAKFQIDYGKLVDEVRLKRKRGTGDAKEYLAINYNEQIKAIARKYKIPLNQIDDLLNYEHERKTRTPKAKDAANDFDLN